MRTGVSMRQIQSRIQIRFVEVSPVYSYDTLMNFNSVARQSDDTLDVTFRRIVRKPKNYDVTAVELWRPPPVVIVDEFVDKDSLAIMESWQH